VRIVLAVELGGPRHDRSLRRARSVRAAEASMTRAKPERAPSPAAADPAQTHAAIQTEAFGAHGFLGQTGARIAKRLRGGLGRTRSRGGRGRRRSYGGNRPWLLGFVRITGLFAFGASALRLRFRLARRSHGFGLVVRRLALGASTRQHEQKRAGTAENRAIERTARRARGAVDDHACCDAARVEKF
jgi:hypothetical protein